MSTMGLGLRARLFASSVVLTGLVAVSDPAVAQMSPGSSTPSTPSAAGPSTSQPVNPAPAPSAPGGVSQLQEVVVTAERRETNLQRTPAAVEVVSSATLDRQRIVQFTDLNTVLTNTQIVPIGTASQVIIRGIGNNFVDPRADPAVATSIDGLFYTRPLPVGFGFLDVARVEDLEGPQGTLYGRAAAGGAINIVNNQPTQKFGGYVQATGGNLDEHEFTGVLNVPIYDKLAVRLAYDRDIRDGYISDFYDDKDNDLFRLSAKWRPIDRLTIYAETNYDHNGGHGQTPESYPCTGSRAWVAETPANCAALPPGGATLLNGREGTYVDSDLVHVDYDLGWATATSISGFVGTHERSMFPEGSNFTDTFYSDNYDYSEELRLAGHDSASRQGGFSWQVGAFLFDSTGDYFFHTQRPGNNLPPTGTQQFSKIPQSSEAGYGQATYGITNRLRLTGGLRFTHDFKGITYSSSAYLPPFFTKPSVPTTGEASDRTSKVTYKVGLEYDLAPGKLIYGTISSGYAPGGVNGGNPNVPLLPDTTPAVFQPETITAYEVGSKNRFFDNRLQLNGAFYYYDFNNYQYLFPSFVQGGGIVHTVAIEDAGSVTDYGLELNALLAATRNDRLSASLSLSHGTFGQLAFAGIALPSTPTETDTPSGSELVNDPKWSALIGYEHTLPVNADTFATFGVNSKLSGKYLLIVASTVPADYQGSYVQTDANVALHLKDDKYQVRFFVKNIENVPVNVYGEGAGFNLYGILPPRTYGVTVTANF